jgi:hypothetical protein
MFSKIKLMTLYLVAGFAFALATNSNVFGQELDCYPVPAGYDCTDWVESSKTVTVSMFPDCEFNLTFETKECTKTQLPCLLQKIIQIRITGYSWDWEECTGVTAWMFPGYPDDFDNIDEVHFRILFWEFQKQLAREQFVEDYNNMPYSEKIKYLCTVQNSECQSPTGLSCNNYEVVYSTPKCVKTCWWENQLGHIWFSWGRCPQDEDACCKQIYKFCYCESTNTVLVTEETTSQPGSCIQPQTPVTCGVTAPLGSTACIHMCPEE